MRFFLMKWRRYVRLSPIIAWREFWHPLLNRGQMLQALLTVIVLKLALQTASPKERDILVSDWENWFTAFGIACAVWALFSLARAPFIARAEDSAKGRWLENRFIFHQPHLVAMFRCRATGFVELYKFRVPFVEPDSFIEYSLELDPDVRSRAEWGFGGVVLVSPVPAMQWPGTGGAKLPRNRQAVFSLKLELETISSTARIFCRSFIIGNPDDTDGTPGNYQFPPGGSAAGQSARQSAP